MCSHSGVAKEPAEEGFVRMHESMMAWLMAVKHFLDENTSHVFFLLLSFVLVFMYFSN
jgi:diacylglycerol kinase